MLTKAQWETFLDVSRNYAIATLQGSSDTAALKASLVSAIAPLRGYTQIQLEEKMEEFYGPDWKRSGGPLYTACQFIASVTYSVCFQNGWNILSPNWNYCEKVYRDYMKLCGLIPEGL